MDETILERLNERVKPEDTLYFLGDFAFGDKKNIPAIRSRIACKNIYAIFGNHDEAIRRNANLRDLFIVIKDMLHIHVCGVPTTLTHYPMQVWDHSGSGSYNLFGHCHGHLQECKGRKMDVGVDTNNFYPYSEEEIHARLSVIEPYKPDHH